MNFIKEKNVEWGLLFLRLIIGGIMMFSHGYPKLVMLMSSQGAQFPDPLGVGNVFSLALTVFSEFFCSLLLILGVKTRFIVIPLIVTMFVAAFIVHGVDPWKKKEMAVLFLTIYTTLFFTGGGKFELKK